MFRLKFFDKEYRPDDVKGIEISERSLDLAGRLDSKFQDKNFSNVKGLLVFLWMMELLK